MYKIGLFFGTFNPIHNGHLITANYIVQHTNIDEVLYVISPSAPFKLHDSFASFGDRVEMVRLATQNNNKIGYSTVEMDLEEPTYTINTLQSLDREKDDDEEYCIIIGADNLYDIENWKNFEDIISNYEIYVCDRIMPNKEFNLEDKIKELEEKYDVLNIHIIRNIPIVGISSSFIRNELRAHRNVDYYIPAVIQNYIYKNKLYNTEFR